MYLSTLYIRNFRSIICCELKLNSGLNVIVGENNIGKSTVIDALRALLLPIDEKNFYLTDLDIGKQDIDLPVEIDYIFDGLTIDEEAIFIEALIPCDEKFKAHFHVKLHPGKYGRRLIAQKWCGAHENHPIPTEILEELVSVYLPPLRNPTDGLKPGYSSQIARLVKSFSSDQDRQDLEATVGMMDSQLKNHNLISNATATINKKIEAITGIDMLQRVNMSFSATEFNKILSRLALFIESMEVEQNGLGYNNVIYTAAVLSQLTHDNKAAFKALLIEEPEAHLHPQLQVLLLRHLAEQANPREESAPPVQVIVTSHSPIFASQAPLNSIISIHRKHDYSLSCVSIADLKIPDPKRRKLERFLDATRAELFFAKKLIMVEGIAEALLVPLFAKKIDIDLKEKSVSIVNVQGLNFNAFLEIINKQSIEIPCAVITDSDPRKNEGNEVYPKLDDSLQPSPAALALKRKETHLIKIFLSKKTFEYDIALDTRNLPTILSALKTIKPKLAKRLDTEINAISENHKKTEIFFKEFKKSCKSKKGEFAQELAILIENGEFFEPPHYIIQAIKHAAGVSTESISLPVEINQ